MSENLHVSTIPNHPLSIDEIKYGGLHFKMSPECFTVRISVFLDATHIPENIIVAATRNPNLTITFSSLSSTALLASNQEPT
jgi:hypothetical protein